MMENKKLFYGILLVVLIIVGAGLFVYLAESPPEESKEPISCKDSLDCPLQMKCENHVCVDVGCIEEGGMGPSAGINPEWLDHLPTECCRGLKSIKYFKLYDENCNFKPMEGAPSIVCTKCGDGQCGKGETKCNCPEDCREAESSTKVPKKTCSEECKEREWDYGICRSWKPTDDLWRCKHDELDIGYTADCYVPSGTIKESKTCCCGGNINKECAKAGEEISPVEHRQGTKCCNGLVGIVPGRWLYPLDHADCSIVPPYETPHVQCTPCGNGLCETEYGENSCNCPKDCK